MNLSSQILEAGFAPMHFFKCLSWLRIMQCGLCKSVSRTIETELERTRAHSLRQPSPKTLEKMTFPCNIICNDYNPLKCHLILSMERSPNSIFFSLLATKDTYLQPKSRVEGHELERPLSKFMSEPIIKTFL